MAEFETSALELDCIAADSPSALVGYTSIKAKVILGASFGLAGTPAVLPDVYVVSAAASVEIIFTVIVTAVPTAASSLA